MHKAWWYFLAVGTRQNTPPTANTNTALPDKKKMPRARQRVRVAGKVLQGADLGLDPVGVADLTGEGGDPREATQRQTSSPLRTTSNTGHMSFPTSESSFCFTPKHAIASLPFSLCYLKKKEGAVLGQTVKRMLKNWCLAPAFKSKLRRKSYYLYPQPAVGADP